MSLLTVKNVKKIYTTRFGSVKVQALNDVNFSVEEGEYVAIMGESGSGKTTLLNILASLDTATSGQVLLNGQELSKVSQKDLCAFRRDHLGFVFQDFNLLDTMSLRDNIFLPLVLAGMPYREMEERLLPLARKLAIADILDKYPYEVSGGQKPDHGSRHRAGGRADGGAGFQSVRETFEAIRGDKRGGADDSHGDPQHTGGGARGAGAFYQGRPCVSPDLSGRAEP